MKARMTAAAIVMGLVASATAQAQSPTRPTEIKAPATTAIPQQGMRIYIDPATGAWVDSPVTEEQKQEAARAAGAVDFSKIDTILHADGSIEYRMNGQMLESVVATRNADGTLRLVCSEHGLDHGHGPVVPAQGGRDVR